MLEIAGGIIIAVLILANLETSLFCCGILLCLGACLLFPIQASLLVGFIIAGIIFETIKDEYGGNPWAAGKALVKALKPTNKGKK